MNVPHWSITALAALVLLASRPPAFADVISEVEPNDALEEANPLIGLDDLGAFGVLGNVGDPWDFFSFAVVTGGNVHGAFTVSTPLVGINELRLFILDAAGDFVDGASSPVVGSTTVGQSVVWDALLSDPGVYYAMVGRSGFIQPVPSAAWEFRLQSLAIPGAHGAGLSSGPQSVPEPGSLVLLLTGALPMLWAARRRRRAP